MMPFSRISLAPFALVAFGLAGVCPAAAQSLNGQPVHLTDRFTDKNTIREDFGIQTVTPTDAVFLPAQGNAITTTVTPTQITFANNTTGYEIFLGTFAFNGFVVSETGPSPFTILNVVVDPSTTAPGFDASHISFDATNVFADFQNVTFNSGQQVVLDVNPSAPVPESSTTVSFGFLLMLGLGGAVVAARKKKTAA